MEIRVAGAVFTFSEGRAVAVRKDPGRGLWATLSSYFMPSIAEKTEEFELRHGFKSEKESRGGSLALVQFHPCNFRFVKEQTPENCMRAVNHWGDAISYVKEQTPELCLAAVSNSGLSLRYVKEQTPEICLAAVVNDPRAFRYVKKPTFPIMLAAVTRDAFVFEEICEDDLLEGLSEEENRALCIAAVTANPDHLELLDDIDRDVMLAAVREDGRALRHIEEQTPEVCFAAVMQTHDAAQYIRYDDLASSSGETSV